MQPTLGGLSGIAGTFAGRNATQRIESLRVAYELSLRVKEVDSCDDHNVKVVEALELVGDYISCKPSGKVLF